MLPERELLALSPHEWAVLCETYQKREARQRAWECRLHGLKHKSGRAITEADFLPSTAASQSAAPTLSDEELAARWRSPRVEYR